MGSSQGRSSIRSGSLMSPPTVEYCRRLAEGLPEDCSTPRSVTSESTVASVSDRRRVHFADGVLPGCRERMCRRADTLLAEWFYIDRDICGVSLFKFRDQVFEPSR